MGAHKYQIYFNTRNKGLITWRTFNPGVELSPVNRVEFFCDYMDDFNPRG
jgi:hypothetical protein